MWTRTLSRPGPQSGVIPSGFGHQVESTRPKTPSVKFGSSVRQGLGQRTVAPGPIYGSPSSMGRQASSIKPSSPHYGFGTSTREHSSVVYSSETCKRR